VSEETKKEENLEEQEVKSEESPQEKNDHQKDPKEETGEEKTESPSEEIDLGHEETGPDSQTEDHQEEKGVSESSTEQEETPSEEDDLLASLLEEAQEEESEESEEEIVEELAKKEEAPKREDPEEKEEGEKGNRFLAILFVLGMVMITGLLAGGGVLLWYLWHVPFEQKPLPVGKEEKLAEQSVSSTKSSVPLVTAPIGVEDRKLLVLENFLIPYQRETGEYVFVKAKVLLYFINDHDYSAAQKKEVLWREHVYQILKNVPLYVWENPNGSKIVQKELLTYLRKKQIDGIVPFDLEINAYILK